MLKRQIPLALLALAFVAATLLVLFSGLAHAEAVFDNERGSLRVHDAPCPADIAVHAAQGRRGYYRAADATILGQHFRACATLVHVNEHPDLYVHVIYDDGTDDLIPYSDFRDEEPPTT